MTSVIGGLFRRTHKYFTEYFLRVSYGPIRIQLDLKQTVKRMNLTRTNMDFLHPGINYCRLSGLYPVLVLCVLLLVTSPRAGYLDRRALLALSGERSGIAALLLHMTPRLYC